MVEKVQNDDTFQNSALSNNRRCEWSLTDCRSKTKVFQPYQRVDISSWSCKIIQNFVSTIAFIRIISEVTHLTGSELTREELWWWSQQLDNAFRVLKLLLEFWPTRTTRQMCNKPFENSEVRTWFNQHWFINPKYLWTLFGMQNVVFFRIALCRNCFSVV